MSLPRNSKIFSDKAVASRRNRDAAQDQHEAHVEDLTADIYQSLSDKALIIEERQQDQSDDERWVSEGGSSRKSRKG